MSDVVPATPEAEASGQGSELPVEVPEGGQEVEPFYTDPHSKTAYGTREELDQAMKDSFMMQGAFTKKMQAHAKDREDLEKRIAENQKFYDETAQHASEYKQFQRLINERPDVYKAMKAQLGQAPSAGTTQEIVEKLISEKIGPELEDLRSYKKQQEEEAELNAVYEELTQQYPDLDRAAIETEFENLTGMKSLVEMIHHGLKGRGSNPLEVERKMTQKLAQKQKAGLAPASKTQPSPSIESGSIEEVGERLRAAAR